jgi:L-arginine dehydrogenase
MSAPIPVLDDAAIARLLTDVDVPRLLRGMFASLQAGAAVQPPQGLVAFPQTPGDVIT